MKFLKGLYHNLISQSKREKIYDYYKVIALLLLCLFWLLLGWMIGKGPPKGEGWLRKKEEEESSPSKAEASQDKPSKPVEYEGGLKIGRGGVTCPVCGLVNLGCRIKCMRCEADIPKTGKEEDNGN